MRDKTLRRRLGGSSATSPQITHIPARSADAPRPRKTPRVLTVWLAGATLLASFLATLVPTGVGEQPAMLRLRDVALRLRDDASISVLFVEGAPGRLDADLRDTMRAGLAEAAAAISRVGLAGRRRLHDGACARRPSHDDPGFGRTSCWFDTLGVPPD